MENMEDLEEKDVIVESSKKKKRNRKNVTETMNDAEATLGTLGKALDFLKNNGVSGILSAAMFLILIIGFTNPEIINDRLEKVKEKRHTEQVKTRMENDEVIQTCIKELREELDADRVMVFETHNGGVSLNNIPFLYVDMSYEDNRRGLHPLADEYKNLRISRYPFFNALYKDLFWYGSAEEVDDIDPSLYYRVVEDGDTYIAFMVTYGKELVSGCICVAYTGEEHASPIQVRSAMYKYGSIIGPLLKENETNRKN